MVAVTLIVVTSTSIIVLFFPKDSEIYLFVLTRSLFKTILMQQGELC